MLVGFPGTVLFVSHDRYFVKQVATGILEFGQTETKQYGCGYEEYLQNQLEAEEHTQETLLERMLETETELEECEAGS